MGYTNTNRKRTTVNTNWADDNVLDNGLEFHFPIQDGMTVSKNDFLQLNDNGEIFIVGESGSVRTTIPLGQDVQWSESLSPENDKDNLTRWIDDKNFIMCFSHYNSVLRSYSVYAQGGSVTEAGNLLFLNAPTLLSSNGQYAEFDLDRTTLEGNRVNGLFSISIYRSSTQLSQALPFEYSKDTQEFTLGEPISEGYLSGDSRDIVLTTNIGAGKYLIASNHYRTTGAVIVTVTDLSITIGEKLNWARARYGDIVYINDNKVILLSHTYASKMEAKILNIEGDVITQGNTTLGDFQLYAETTSTNRLNRNNKFHTAMNSVSGGGREVREQTYDAVNDVVIFNPGSVNLTQASFVISDISFYNVTGAIAVSGSIDNTIPTVFIVDFANGAVTQKTVGTTSGRHVGCDVNYAGGLVFCYASASDNTARGVASYGRLGDITSNLDAEKIIGVASDSLGHIQVSGSMITNSNLNLAVNSRVYVDGAGGISTTNADGSLYVGFAIKTDSFILELTK
tara:strand:+ start:1857 stop:3386 length:1530 start_codon:yes stop_codon:yes gene_type:complete